MQLLKTMSCLPWALHLLVIKSFAIYPSGIFFRDESMVCAQSPQKGNVKIDIVVRFSEQSHDTTMEYYGSYFTCDQYSIRHLVISGYEARTVSCADERLSSEGFYELRQGDRVNCSVTSCEPIEPCIRAL